VLCVTCRCDPHLSALEVRFSRRGAIQIYVYRLPLPASQAWPVLTTGSSDLTERCNTAVVANLLQCSWRRLFPFPGNLDVFIRGNTGMKKSGNPKRPGNGSPGMNFLIGLHLRVWQHDCGSWELECEQQSLGVHLQQRLLSWQPVRLRRLGCSRLSRPLSRWQYQWRWCFKTRGCRSCRLLRNRGSAS